LIKIGTLTTTLAQLNAKIGSIEDINTLFSLFQQVKKQVKKDINDAVQPWGIRQNSIAAFVIIFRYFDFFRAIDGKGSYIA